MTILRVSEPDSYSTSHTKQVAVIELGKKDFDLIDQITVRDPSKRNRLVNFDTVWGVNCFGDE